MGSEGAEGCGDLQLRCGPPRRRSLRTPGLRSFVIHTIWPMCSAL